MIQIKTPKPEQRSSYLDHKAFYDKNNHHWYINEEVLEEDDYIFFFIKGEPVEVTNLRLMFYLSTHPFFSLSENIQIDIVKALSSPRKTEKDMEIPFGDFARIVDLFSNIDEERFYSKCQEALISDDFDKSDTLCQLGLNELEQALFYYCFYK